MWTKIPQKMENQSKSDAIIILINIEFFHESRENINVEFLTSIFINKGQNQEN